jgi:hypothetical protein
LAHASLRSFASSGDEQPLAHAQANGLNSTPRCNHRVLSCGVRVRHQEKPALRESEAWSCRRRNLRQVVRAVRAEDHAVRPCEPRSQCVEHALDQHDVVREVDVADRIGEGTRRRTTLQPEHLRLGGRDAPTYDVDDFSALAVKSDSDIAVVEEPNESGRGCLGNMSARQVRFASWRRACEPSP